MSEHKTRGMAWVNFDKMYPIHPDPPTRAAWNAWFRRHTIDPGMVLTEGWLAVDFDRYRISYPSYDLDSLHDPDADDLVLVQREIQLEARPSEPPCF